jgi:hypothetical protein
VVDRRKHRRYAKRLKIRFGEKGFNHAGLTSDISASGLFVITVNMIKPSTRLHLEVTTPEDTLFYIEGVVVRLAVVPPELRQAMKGGFGLRFLSGTEMMAELVPHLKDRAQLSLCYDNVEALKKAWEAELKRGGALARSDKSYAMDSIVTVEIDLPFAGRRLGFEARVVHVAPEQENRFGVAFMFVDVPNVTKALEDLVNP